MFTKFDPGDEVWIVHFQQVIKAQISKIYIDCWFEEYKLCEIPGKLDAGSLFPTKELAELELEKVIKRIKENTNK
jgi:hypothetical protein